MDPLSQLSNALTGRYTIEREIGAGGMATVYLAHDLRHDRRVALKVLKPELGAVLGAERFLSEIRVTAKLQHPNLLALFDSGESDGLLYYVMPYIEGESLRHRLDREKQLPVDEAVRWATTIAGALDYAHRHGVIHRDLKPENVLLHDGQPVIADFGIALAISNAGGARVTQTGLSLGTPQYMSPEQATGDRQIDARTDIYSLGALTFEMLTGEPPHTGPTAQAIIAKLMTDEPRVVSMLRRSAPPHVDAAVHRALEKLPADRFSTARDFADALNGKALVAPPRMRVATTSSRGWQVVAAGSALVAIASFAWAFTRAGRSSAPPPRVRFALVLPDSAALDATSNVPSFELSPDGTALVYSGVKGVFVRRLDDLTPRLLTSERGRNPRFSPDGRFVGYVVDGTLRKLPVAGGTPVTIVDSVSRFGWSSRGVIVFTRSGPIRPDLWRVGENGGFAERIVHQLRPTDYAYGMPTFLPDGDALVVPSVTARGDSIELAAFRLSDGKMRYLGQPAGHPIYLSGVLFFLAGRDEVLLAAPFDAKTLRFTGTPVPVLYGAMRKLSSLETTVSSTGTMAYLPGAQSRQVIEVDRKGQERLVLPTSGFYNNPRYSPDGRRIALQVGQSPSIDIWIYDMASATMSRLTNSSRATVPEWTPDGARIAWMQQGGAVPGVYWRAADGSDTTSLLVRDVLGLAFPPSGNYLLTSVSASRSLVRIQLDSSRARTPVLSTSGPPAARVSPDGKWLAYISQESGRAELYVRSLSHSGGRYQISADGAGEPEWNPRGGELFYRAGLRLIGATLDLAREPRVIRRDTLPFIMTGPSGAERTYNVSSDGQRFIIVRPVGASSPPIVVTNWFDDVREKLNARR